MKKRAPNNRTLDISAAEARRLRKLLVSPKQLSPRMKIIDSVINSACEDIFPLLPKAAINLLILDPPYNLSKRFNGRFFSRKPVAAYTDWLAGYLEGVKSLLAPDASIYICGDWRTSPSIFEAASRHFTIRNRITWEREKGRASTNNWKNASEDIWYCTVSNSFTFHQADVKLRRRVLAPYRDGSGKPKDWRHADNGKFRDTAPSNFWTDITIPFWSMPENTDHPTQKSEKLVAKLILASSNPGDIVLDPFAGSGTTPVTAAKLGRKYISIDVDEWYCLLTLKRLEQAGKENTIQGFEDGVFWERNSLIKRQK